MPKNVQNSAEITYKYPRYLKPKLRPHDLVRIGSIFDGGYVISNRSILHSNHLLSFGLNDDCTFEKQFCIIAKCSVTIFDPSVNLRFWILRTIKSLIFSVIRLDIYKILIINRIITYCKLFVFSKNNKHIKKFIGYSSNNSISFEEALLISEAKKDFFLKIDIEGWEYRILNSIADRAVDMTGLAIEFHDVDLHSDKIESFISRISDHMELVHFHANSEVRQGEAGLSTAIELSFMNRKLIDFSADCGPVIIPIAGLDAPNSRKGVDYKVLFDLPECTEERASAGNRA